MKFFKQLKEAIFERVAGDKAGTIKGQFWFNTVTNQPKINNGTVIKTFVVTDDAEIIPLGDQGVDGTWRIVIVGAEIQFQRRSLGVWDKKGSFV